MAYDLTALARDLTNLYRMPTSDRVALNFWFAEAQEVAKRIRASALTAHVPKEIFTWLANADLRAKDPQGGARENAGVAKLIEELVRRGSVV